MDKTTIVVTTLVAYNILLIAIGIWASSRTKSESDYFLGGKNLGPIVAAISYSASSSSAWTLLGMSGAAYLLGLSAVWIIFGAWVGMLVAWYYVAPRMRRHSASNDNITIVDFLVHGIDGFWRQTIVATASVVILVSFAFYVAAQFQGAGSTISSTFGMSFGSSIMLGGAVIMVYTFLGGFWAVSVTDTVQGTLMVVTAVVLPAAALTSVGGVSGFLSGLESLSDPAYLQLTGQNVGLAAIGFVAGSLGIGFGPVGQPHLLVRFMAVRDEKSIRVARLITVFWYLLVYVGMLMVGLIGRILIPGLEGNAVETVFFELTDLLFSPLLASIMIAAVLSAIMSTADSQLLVAASSITHDLGLGNRFPEYRVLVARFAIAGVVIASVLIALYVPATIFDRVLFAWSALGAAFGPTVLLLLAGYVFSARIIFIAILMGFLLAVFFFMLPNTPGDYAERIIPFIASFSVLWFARKPAKT